MESRVRFAPVHGRVEAELVDHERLAFRLVPVSV